MGRADLPRGEGRSREQPGAPWRLLLAIFCALAIGRGLALRFSAADHGYIAQWDEAYHALVAKNLVAHPLVPTLYDEPLLEYDHRDWRANHIWLHKPPVPLWLMAASTAITGPGRDLAARWPSVILGTLSILLTYILARELWGAEGRLAGACAVLLHALNPLFIRLVSGTVPSDHVDLVTAFFVELTFLLYVAAARRESRSLALAAGAALGVSWLSKSLPALVPVGAALPLLLKRREGARSRAGLLLASFVTVSVPWSIYAAFRWPEEFFWESSYAWRHLFSALEGHDRSAAFYLEMIPAHFGGIGVVAHAVVIPAVALAAIAAVRRRDAPLAAALAWALLPYVVFSAARTKMYAYVAPAAPALLLLVGRAFGTACAVWRSSREARGRFGAWGRAAAAAGVAVLAVHVVSLAGERLGADCGVCPSNVLL